MSTFSLLSLYVASNNDYACFRRMQVVVETPLAYFIEDELPRTALLQAAARIKRAAETIPVRRFRIHRVRRMHR